MECSSKDVPELRGFIYLVPNCNKDFLIKKFTEARSKAMETGRTHIVRLMETNYFRFEALFLPDGGFLLSISTVRGTNNINLRDAALVKELADISCCSVQNQALFNGITSYLSENKTLEAEVYDLEEKEISIKFEPDCNVVSTNEFRAPEVREGQSWATSDLASTDHLYLKLLGGQAKLVAISTERPQNSIKFATPNRLRSLCCFAALVWNKLSECQGLLEAINELEAMTSTSRKRRK